VNASPDFAAAMDKFRGGDIPNVIADLKSQGVQDADKLTRRHMTMIGKWNKLVKDEGSTSASYLGLLQREIYAKAKF
jgi:hypothetical protein